MTQEDHLTMVTHIHSATLMVRDQDAAIAFYTEKLGWEKRADSPFGEGHRWIEVAPHGAQTAVALITPASAGAPPEAAGSYNGVSVIADDVQKAYDELSARGVSFTQPPERMPWGPMATFFTDLDGNTLFLTEDE